ncbi:hypothetical protein PHMEG_00035323 [Phytophthora megakarya]|uniref:WRKY19-like zinc finger domain-containing protein n=1 Tax=Phytophthora megakarya TaxID=4795 RepID=A0A225UQN2_9STRA|nr:hypothetical protein PHMEG_00035323 [Phytophthora megakarya]
MGVAKSARSKGATQAPSTEVSAGSTSCGCCDLMQVVVGGSIKCKKNGCDKKAKARGLCWAHGGGTKCRDAECTKVAVSNGYCWAHGGGKRCAYDGCIKPAYERTRNLCEIHFAQLRNGSSYEVYCWL